MDTNNFSVANPLLAMFTLVVWLVFIALSFIVGRKVLRYIRVNNENKIENALFSIPTGMGVIGFGIFLLGLFGLYHKYAILSWILLLLLLSGLEMWDLMKGLPNLIKTFYQKWKEASSKIKLLISIIISFLFITLLLSLVPPWQYDGLMYHLEGPKRFLDSLNIFPIPEIQQANGPLLTEMQFTLGIILGMDTLANLIHLTFGILLVLAIYLFGEKYLGKEKGWIPACIFLATPLIPIIASYAYVELAWSLYIFLALLAILIWMEGRNKPWLVLAGILTGFSLGTKYMALGHATILGLVVLWITNGQQWRKTTSDILLFALPAIILGSPWYLKNLIATGNPVYPLFFGGPDWPVERVELTSIYLNSFGVGRRFIDYILLPINIFRYQRNFSTIVGHEIPNPLFLLALIYPIIKRSKVLDIVAFITLLGYLLWALGSQQTRFMIPIFPGLSILSAWTIIYYSEKFVSQKMRGAIVGVTVGGFLFLCMLSCFINIVSIQPISYLAGFETMQTFLKRMGGLTGNFGSIQFINENLYPEDRVLMIWDGQIYYCEKQCIPDSDNYSWTYLVTKHYNFSELVAGLNQMGITHIQLNHGNRNFILRHDPSGDHHKAYIFLRDEFIPSCTKLVYQDISTAIYRLDCLEEHTRADNFHSTISSY
jgi:hypothetical protein